MPDIGHVFYSINLNKSIRYILVFLLLDKMNRRFKGGALMARMKKGQILECYPCGREVTVSKEGVSNTTVYCCGLPMKHKIKASTKKKTTRKITAKKTTKKSE